MSPTPRYTHTQPRPSGSAIKHHMCTYHAVCHQEKTCEVITPYGVITQFPKNGRLFTPKYRPDHTINMWSHRQNFVHTINFQDHTDIILFTPSRCYSHSWNFDSHHLNFVHTINSQDHTVIILFTPSRRYSHSWNFGSHHLNLFHTISIVFTLKNRVVHTQQIFNVCDQAHCTCVF